MEILNRRIKKLETVGNHSIEELRHLYTHIFGYKWAVDRYGQEVADEMKELAESSGLPVHD